MWANAQRDGRRAEYRWRPLFCSVEVWQTSNLRPLRLGEGKKEEDRKKEELEIWANAQPDGRPA